MWLWLLAVALAVGADALLAPPPASLEISRRPTAPVRQGEPTSSTLVVANPSGRRFTGVLRDAWQPTAGEVFIDVAYGVRPYEALHDYAFRTPMPRNPRR